MVAKDRKTGAAGDPAPAAEPRSHSVTLHQSGETRVFQAPEDEYLLYAMIDQGLESPYVCEQGWCLACAARLVSGDVDRSDALTHFPEDDAAGFLLLCSTRPRSNLVLDQDVTATRREMTDMRISHNLLARAYPPGVRAGFRRGRARRTDQS